MQTSPYPGSALDEDESAALQRAEAAVSSLLESRRDRWYPTFHIAPVAGWINDPNGLVFHDGRYHVYFQHNPYGSVWDTIHWGHVSSADLVHWSREPIAIAPSIEGEADGVFSGSATVDDEGRIVVLYTGHEWNDRDDFSKGGRARQILASSVDGERFTKHGVVIEQPEGIRQIRDPKVWREGALWHLVIGAEAADGRGEVWLYTSADLVEWTREGTLYRSPDEHVVMLECPDFFPLGDRWVLVVSPMGLRPDGHRFRNLNDSGYVVGTWAPGQPFVVEHEFRPLDGGANFYAPQSFEAPDGRRILIGWMGTFQNTLASQPEDGFAGQHTILRELSLTDAGLVAERPIAETAALHRDAVDFGAFELGADEHRVLLEDAPALDVEVVFDLDRTTAERFGFAVAKTPSGRETMVAVDAQTQHLVVDRRHGAGEGGYRAVPVPASGELSLRILVDRSSVEVFIGDGVEAVSSLIFPDAGPRALELFAECGGASVTRLVVHRMAGVYADR